MQAGMASAQDDLPAETPCTGQAAPSNLQAAEQDEQDEEPVRRSSRASKRRKMGSPARTISGVNEDAPAQPELDLSGQSVALKQDAQHNHFESDPEKPQPGLASAASDKPDTGQGIKQSKVSGVEHEDGPGHEAGDQLSEKHSKKKVKLTPGHGDDLPLRRKSRSKWDNPTEMLTNQRSPLATAMLRDLLCNPRAWDVLTESERKRVLGEFPDKSDILNADTDQARPDIISLRNNNDFRHDISRYQEDLRDGRHDPEWITQAQTAHRKRELGAYNDFLASKFEEEWGIPMPALDDEPAPDEVNEAEESAQPAAGPSSHDDGEEHSDPQQEVQAERDSSAEDTIYVATDIYEYDTHVKSIQVKDKGEDNTTTSTTPEALPN